MPTKTITALPLGPDTTWTTPAQTGWGETAWACAKQVAPA